MPVIACIRDRRLGLGREEHHLEAPAVLAADREASLLGSFPEVIDRRGGAVARPRSVLREPADLASVILPPPVLVPDRRTPSPVIEAKPVTVRGGRITPRCRRQSGGRRSPPAYGPPSAGVARPRRTPSPGPRVSGPARGRSGSCHVPREPFVRRQRAGCQGPWGHQLRSCARACAAACRRDGRPPPRRARCQPSTHAAPHRPESSPDDHRPSCRTGTWTRYCADPMAIACGASRGGSMGCARRGRLAR